MAPVIRPASRSDREQILALAPRLTHGAAVWRDSTAVRDAVIGWVEESLEKADDNNEIFVADEGGSISGFITVARKDHWSGSRDGYIGELVVSPDHEGSGVGSALIRSAVEWARERGFARVSVATGAANTRARQLYQKLGFEEEDVTLSTPTGRRGRPTKG